MRDTGPGRPCQCPTGRPAAPSSAAVWPGGQVYVRNYSLPEIPVFVKAGSVIPIKTDDFSTYK